MNKDTPEWREYYKACAKYKAMMEEKRPVNIIDPDYLRLKYEWDKEYAMNYPNPPGYYRANND